MLWLLLILIVALAIYGDRFMAQIDDLNALVQTLGSKVELVLTHVDAISGDVTTVLDILKTAQSTGQPVDLGAAISTLQQASNNLDMLDTHLEAADANLKAVETVPVTTEPEPEPVVETNSFVKPVL